jgi:hypothetical protein
LRKLKSEVRKAEKQVLAYRALICAKEEADSVELD